MAQAPYRGRPHLRFSLRTLMLLPLFCGAVVWLLKYSSRVERTRLTEPNEAVLSYTFSPNGSLIALLATNPQTEQDVFRVIETRTLRPIWSWSRAWHLNKDLVGFEGNELMLLSFTLAHPGEYKYQVWEARSGKRLDDRLEAPPVQDLWETDAGRLALVPLQEKLYAERRLYPDVWYWRAYQVEAWVCLVLIGLSVWSVQKDIRRDPAQA